ncbi:MAG: Uma2 family endonuclease [Nostoc sp.]|uniref:Uma2 family endonuclease n=1 Tax=Nostoc sp. TaxID=1180 RepID=UPI002FEFDA04
MKTVVLASSFKRAFKRLIGRQPQLQERIEERLALLTADPFDPLLQTHKQVVSPGKANADRDYRYKRSEYAARGIAEYWIVDPQRNVVTVLILVDGFYEETRFAGNTAIASTIFPELQLTAEQILNARENNVGDAIS